MRGKAQHNFCWSVVTRFAVLSAFLMLGMLWTSSAWAASSSSSAGQGATSGTSQTGATQTSTSKDETDTSSTARTLKELLKEGYAVDGPLEVVEVSSSSITVFVSGKKNWKITLTGKTVTVKSYQGQTLTASDIQAKARVYICRSKSKITILVLKTKEGTSND